MNVDTQHWYEDDLFHNLMEPMDSFCQTNHFGNPLVTTMMAARNHLLNRPQEIPRNIVTTTSTARTTTAVTFPSSSTGTTDDTTRRNNRSNSHSNKYKWFGDDEQNEEEEELYYRSSSTSDRSYYHEEEEMHLVSPIGSSREAIQVQHEEVEVVVEDPHKVGPCHRRPGRLQRGTSVSSTASSDVLSHTSSSVLSIGLPSQYPQQTHNSSSGNGNNSLRSSSSSRISSFEALMQEELEDFDEIFEAQQRHHHHSSSSSSLNNIIPAVLSTSLLAEDDDSDDLSQGSRPRRNKDDADTSTRRSRHCPNDSLDKGLTSTLWLVSHETLASSEEPSPGLKRSSSFS